jgi:7,8-dihydroneopterin aldolase/epimerase/oxygenase
VNAPVPNAATPLQPSADAGVIRVEGAKVFVRALKVDAEVGVYAHEHGRRQPLVIDVELDVAATTGDHLADTVNYETVAAKAQALAAHGHVKLIETFAERLARALLEDSRVSRARVRVEKPQALAPHAAAGGAEITLTRT